MPCRSAARAIQRCAAAALAAVALFATLPAPASAVPYGPFSITLPVFSVPSPIAVAAGDFNGDGNPDLATARSSAAFLFLWVGNGSGAYSSLTSVATAARPFAVASADLNNDGKLDLVSVGGTSVSVLLGNGDGTFAAHVDYTVPNGTGFRSIVPADVNGDGSLDLVVASPAASSISVLLGNGNGTFAARTDYTTLSAPNTVAVADLDNDGKLDIATISRAASGFVSVFLGTGAGAFGARSDFACGSLPGAIALGDLNGDGNADAAVALTGGYSVLLGAGNGTLGAAATIAGTQNGEAVAIGDLDADNKPELVMTASNGALYLPGVGNGTFGAATSAVTSASNYDGLTLADINRDGALDVVASSLILNRVSITLSNRPLFGAQRPFRTGNYLNAPNPGSRTLATGDVNGDGHPDAVVANWADTTGIVCFGAGDGSFSSSVTLRTDSLPSSAAAVDLNGDNRADVLFSNYKSNSVSVYLSQPGNTFAPRVDYAVGALPMAVTAGDVNSDGKPDMIALAAGSNISVLLNNGDGTFGPASPKPTALAGGGVQLGLATGDLNADGLLDIVVTSTALRYSAMFGNGAGQFTAHTDSVLVGHGFNPWGVAIGDLTGDGVADLAFANRDQAYIELKQGNGVGVFTPMAGSPVQPTNATGCPSVAIGDVNGDGHMDLVTSTWPGYMLGDGQGGFGPYTMAPFLNIGLSPTEFPFNIAGTATRRNYSVALDDMDGDGRTDMLLAGIPHSDSLGGNRLAVQLRLKPTQLTLGLPAGPIVQSQPLTLTATVNVPFAGAGVPVDADTVTFFDGFTVLGKAAVLGNVATLTIPAPWPGMRTFRAVYGGCAPFWIMNSQNPPGLGYYTTDWDFEKAKYTGSIAPARTALVLPSSVLGVPTPRPGRLALERITNPALGGRMALAFTLPSAASARLEVMDVTGRRVFTREVGTMGAGRHTVHVGGDTPLRSGVYFVRLSQGADGASARVTVLR
jgi:hypothetical protein